MVIAVVNTKLFINKKLNKESSTAALTQAVSCEPITTPLYGVNLFGT